MEFAYSARGGGLNLASGIAFQGDFAARHGVDVEYQVSFSMLMG